ncbi:hypothetical protein F4802DRAFT_601621 [Xylaria palmicola]|nr:hypothetical protein F4802DRAFT_601621 [Xylaria palmicola]
MFVEYTVDVVYTGVGVIEGDEAEVSSVRVEDDPDTDDSTGLVPVSKAAELGDDIGCTAVSSTGQTVVYNGISSVVTEPMLEEHPVAPEVDGWDKTGYEELGFGVGDTPEEVASICPLKVFPSKTVWVTGHMVVYSETVSVVALPTTVDRNEVVISELNVYVDGITCDEAVEMVLATIPPVVLLPTFELSAVDGVEVGDVLSGTDVAEVLKVEPKLLLELTELSIVDETEAVVGVTLYVPLPNDVGDTLLEEVVPKIRELKLLRIPPVVDDEATGYPLAEGENVDFDEAIGEADDEATG